MKHLIIGTAGHVDHGKTMLVKAITGVDTDRLREEKERGISIELGFASLTLPSGRRASLVDVPGHERFIKNMLAGASGIDIVLLIIAADEGIMPQTREHLDIIQLLQVNRGIIVITKTDLVDEEWLELVEEEIKEYMKSSFLQNAPLIKVSAVTGENITNLLEEIDCLAEETKEKPAAGLPRLPIDRVFSVTGFGTVVTGTLVSGKLKIGDEVEVFPQGLTSRVRSLQVHGKSTDISLAGQRVAVNLTGLEVEQINRGNVLSLPNSLTLSYRLDVHLLLLKNTEKPLKQRSRIRLYIGTTEVLGRVIFFNQEEVPPGEWLYAQIQLEEPVAVAKNDRFVIRSYSPMHTIGGGTVIDPAAKRHKRYRQDVLDKLATLEKGTPEELVEQHLFGFKYPVNFKELEKETGLSSEQIQNAAEELKKASKIKIIDLDHVLFLSAYVRYQIWVEEIKVLLEQYHRKYPLREGYPKEELRSRKFKDLNNKLFQALLQTMESDQVVRVHAKTISSPQFTPKPNTEQLKILQNIEKVLLNEKFQPPGWSQVIKDFRLKEDHQQEILHYLIRQGTLIKINDDIYLHQVVIKEARKLLSDYFKENKEITIGEARDLLSTSRKYALPLLEYFDRQRLTRRIGDMRVAGKGLEENSSNHFQGS